jgi:hypothetical protein
MSVNNVRDTATATIALSGTVSDAVALEGSMVPVGILTPAALTGTAMTFQGSLDGVTYRAVNNVGGSALTITVAAAKAIGFDAGTATCLMAWKYIKLVSGSAEAAERAITVVLRPV